MTTRQLNMLQRLLDTTSLSGRQWVVVLARTTDGVEPNAVQAST
jgi:hypothetical protein